MATFPLDRDVGKINNRLKIHSTKKRWLFRIESCLPHTKKQKVKGTARSI